MKKIKPILLTIACFTLLSFTIKSSSIFQKPLQDIGIIKQSLLKPNQFNKTQKGTWVLLNGQEINKESKLYKLLEENFDLNILTKKDNKYFLPNASGAFIRASNVNGEGKDPDKDRKVGSIQDDLIKIHEHNYWGGTGNKWYKNFNTNGGGNHPSEKNLSNVKTHNSLLGSETRPVNISMYTYIKISN
ncbi:hypothetical protein IMCC3317_40400 [Kordia antarctica]|uniref:Uncharacterized protein n=1 Tax=Kordia antarctica TaxID=1218801 RepID=A0A7L4ZR27_9FLAO|nr:hypothetical protein [Kordia antarctica]QHI38646.1 hypothetical protein IMCC3317_40400 [Kordia antarctica]